MKQLKLLHRLLSFSDRYQITVQFWPELTAVYIRKHDVELFDYVGNDENAIKSAIQYLERINCVK
ncbi:MAG TPA: hypothetical protein PKK64_07965 [Saprospiraceae bacterium]|nr:hypothetical protein [Saprospiraceae bacterium]HNE63497.1 hypothetical protein [Saprospiraceae bacterium]HNJ54302.1 hypothetical protein [Saprospiraceae bacterium]HNL17675.1 hypothetical protein [Saprospiraceae bacterium]HNM52798.1 hypothetical protein [Saprospiraceae bacterium]